VRRSLPLFTLVTLALSAGVFLPGSSLRADEEKPRIKVLLTSSQGLIDDLEHLVVDLAKEKQQWVNNIFPSIEVFLLGVDWNKPLRWDVLVNDGQDGKSGYRYQPCIPIDRGGREIRTFIKQNLEPIGIDPRLKKRGYYQLTGNVFEGWMRIVDSKTKDYACIAAEGFEDDIPEDMPHPSKSHEQLLKGGYDFALELDNTAAQTELRKLQADQLLAFFMKQIQRKPDETQAKFDLRKLTQQQKYEQLHRIYVEAEHFTVGWKTDVPENQGEAEFVLHGLPETDLFNYLATMGTAPSRFEVLEMPDDPVLGVRVNLPFDDFRRRQLNGWYPAARAASKDDVDTSQRFDEAEKEPAKQVVDLFFDMLVAGDAVGRLDLFADITVADSGTHTLVSGVVAQDGKAADAIVDLLPQVRSGWKVEKDLATVGDTVIHQVDVSADVPQAISDFFGPSGLVYVGTSPSLVWLAGGDGSLEKLKAAIAEVGTSGQAQDGEVQVVAAVDANAPVKFVDLKIHARPLVVFSDEFSEETGIKLPTSISIKPPGGAAGRMGEGPGSGMQPIKPEEMRDVIRNALIDSDDRVTGVSSRMDDHIAGRMTFAPGLLRSVGKVFAKIAKDNL